MSSNADSTKKVTFEEETQKRLIEAPNNLLECVGEIVVTGFLAGLGAIRDRHEKST